jgi:hypothetical protein
MLLGFDVKQCFVVAKHNPTRIKPNANFVSSSMVAAAELAFKYSETKVERASFAKSCSLQGWGLGGGSEQSVGTCETNVANVPNSNMYVLARLVCSS